MSKKKLGLTKKQMDRLKALYDEGVSLRSILRLSTILSTNRLCENAISDEYADAITDATMRVIEELGEFVPFANIVI